MDGQDDRGYSRAPELEDLLALCKALNTEGVKYVLISGFAVMLHGFVRATKDIDLLVDASRENIQRLKRAMAVLPDNAIALIADDEECVARWHRDQSRRGSRNPPGQQELLIETKQTVRPSDADDVQFLRLRIASEDEAPSS